MPPLRPRAPACSTLWSKGESSRSDPPVSAVTSCPYSGQSWPTRARGRKRTSLAFARHVDLNDRGRGLARLWATCREAAAAAPDRHLASTNADAVADDALTHMRQPVAVFRGLPYEHERSEGDSRRRRFCRSPVAHPRGRADDQLGRAQAACRYTPSPVFIVEAGEGREGPRHRRLGCPRAQVARLWNTSHAGRCERSGRSSPKPG